VAPFWGTTVWLALAPVGDGAAPTSVASPIADCDGCHAAVTAEWRTSAHARAGTNELFAARMSVSGTAEDCLPCHVPRPLLRIGLANAVEARADDPEGGVGCPACHEVGRGVAAARDGLLGACAPRRDGRLLENALCGACHRAIYRDVQRQSAAGHAVRCIACHMPRTSDQRGAVHVDHALHVGPLGASIRLAIRREDELVVEITNTNEAHAFPGERHNRVLMLKVVYGGDASDMTNTVFYVLRAPTIFGATQDSDDIGPGRTLAVRCPERGGAVTVSLLYKRVPWILHADAEVLQTVRMPPRQPRESTP
jgi:hypothetical protein